MSDTTIVEAPASQAVVPAKVPQTVKELLTDENFKAQLQMALPKHITPDHFARLVMTAVNRNKDIAACTVASVAQCVLDAAQLGLRLNGREAHLIPFRDNNTNTRVCTLIPDYKGLAALAVRSGYVSNVHADKVCVNDKFKYNKGVVEQHEIDFTKDRGEVYAYYSIVRMKDGGEKADAMSLKDVEAVRARSKAKNNGPWVTDFDEMGKKTITKRNLKTVPQSPELERAIELDNAEYEREEKVVTPFVMPEAETADENAEPATEAVLDRMPELQKLMKAYKKTPEDVFTLIDAPDMGSLDEMTPTEIELAIDKLKPAKK